MTEVDPGAKARRHSDDPVIRTHALAESIRERAKATGGLTKALLLSGHQGRPALSPEQVSDTAHDIANQNAAILASANQQVRAMDRLMAARSDSPTATVEHEQNVIVETLQRHRPDQWRWSCSCKQMESVDERTHTQAHREHQAEAIALALATARHTPGD